MKIMYETVEMEIIFLDEVDVITTSNGQLDNNELPPVIIN